jgi:hypothetical protein
MQFPKYVNVDCDHEEPWRLPKSVNQGVHEERTATDSREDFVTAVQLQLHRWVSLQYNIGPSQLLQKHSRKPKRWGGSFFTFLSHFGWISRSQTVRSYSPETEDWGCILRTPLPCLDITSSFAFRVKHSRPAWSLCTRRCWIKVRTTKIVQEALRTVSRTCLFCLVPFPDVARANLLLSRFSASCSNQGNLVFGDEWKRPLNLL